MEEEAAVAALSEEAGPVPEIDGNRVYANGAAITIRKEDGVCYIFYGTDGKLELPSPGGKTVFGGGKNRDVDGDTSVTLDGVPVSAVYGGGYSDGSHSADVSGDANIDTSGNIIVKTYGGGYAEAKNGDASAVSWGRRAPRTGPAAPYRRRASRKTAIASMEAATPIPTAETERTPRSAPSP